MPPEGVHPIAYRAVLVLDGVGWHEANALVIPDLSLLTLPPYSPELNPVEKVWQYLRANWLAISKNILLEMMKRYRQSAL